MGTHFFNPPRWMGLFEMIPTRWTSKETIETMAHVGGDLLGKTCVYAKDTPNFVGNRIGCFGAAQTMSATSAFLYLKIETTNRSANRHSAIIAVI